MMNNQVSLNAEISDLNCISSLDLSNKCIDSIDETIFNSLTNLKIIHLTHLPENIFKPLTFLDALHLNNNQILCLNEYVFTGLKSLTKLSLNSNQIQIINKTHSMALACSLILI